MVKRFRVDYHPLASDSSFKPVLGFVEELWLNSKEESIKMSIVVDIQKISIMIASASVVAGVIYYSFQIRHQSLQIQQQTKTSRPLSQTIFNHDEQARARKAFCLLMTIREMVHLYWNWRRKHKWLRFACQR